MELINCSIVTVILCQLNIISKNSISETIISCDRVYNSFDNTSHERSILLQRKPRKCTILCRRIESTTVL